MQQNPPLHLTGVPEIPSTSPNTLPDDPTSSSLFDWSDFLDFNLDETLHISFPEPGNPDRPGSDPSQPQDIPGRVRKRDPRLVCSNFLAGRIPCACPELDQKLEEEQKQEELGGVLPGKKRARTAKLPGGALTRCQVPGCEVDISELKGYHKRHRVCLQCANASMVVLDGENKRYCQQCGKFHLLSDFDEGKRSCRRKLEHHNNRRRRKANDSKGSTDNETRPVILVDDVSGDDDTGKDSICVSDQIEEREIPLELDGGVSTLCSGLGSQNMQNESVSFGASSENLINRERQNPKTQPSPIDYDNKSSFYSVCPPGRISFKLYDWNPAEFPRRLRHQIFQWLANMPVELEGYIRPGCTILTAFIAVPNSTWRKLLEEPAVCIKDLVTSPGNMLFGRGTILVYLNDMIFRVTKDTTSVVKIRVKDRSPKLHYIYPTFFEAGMPMEFIACGSNLLQPKFRFLVSFAGRYLEYNICVSSRCCEKGENGNLDHQLVKIYVPQTDLDVFGPAFIEVENQSGLSNFIPILIGDKETCAEMAIFQHNFNSLMSPQKSACEILSLRQTQFSEFVLEVAWLIKKPLSGQKLTSFHIQRCNNLLYFLIVKDSPVILKRVFSYIKSVIDNNLVADIPNAEMRLLREIMDVARNMLDQKLREKDLSRFPSLNGNITTNQSSPNVIRPVNPTTNQIRTSYIVGVEKSTNMKRIKGYFPPLDDGATMVPLLNREVIMNLNLQEIPRKWRGQLLTKAFWTSRPLIVSITAFAVCFGVCTVVLHPQSATHIATSVRRCLFDHS